MNRRARAILFLIAAGALAALCVWGLGGLPPFGQYAGPYGDVINTGTVPERHVTDSVTAINFDYRAMDTLGEEFILFAAVSGVGVLTRPRKDDPPPSPAEGRVPPAGDDTRWLGLLLVASTIVFAFYVIAHAAISPGGGFQGGAMLGTAALVVYLVTEFDAFERVTPHLLLKLADAGGAAGYVLVGAGALLAGAPFLANLLPLGEPGQLRSAGMVPLISAAVGIEVAGGFLLVFKAFISQAHEPEQGHPPGPVPPADRAGQGAEGRVP